LDWHAWHNDALLLATTPENVLFGQTVHAALPI
jgi:hypothetical protein